MSETKKQMPRAGEAAVIQGLPDTRDPKTGREREIVFVTQEAERDTARQRYGTVAMVGSGAYNNTSTAYYVGDPKLYEALVAARKAREAEAGKES